jgi:NADH-quinone oxidoreductase subunit H
MAMYSTLAERKVAAWLQDRMILTERVKAVLQRRWFKVIRKRKFEPNTPNKLFYTGQLYHEIRH